MDCGSVFGCGLCLNVAAGDVSTWGDEPWSEEVGALSTKLISPALTGVMSLPRGASSSMAEDEGPSFSFVLERAALSAMLFALAFRLATPPRAFFTGFSLDGFSLAVCSLSRYPAISLESLRRKYASVPVPCADHILLPRTDQRFQQPPVQA